MIANARTWLPWGVAALAVVSAWATWHLVRRRHGTGPIVVFFHGKGGRDATYAPILDSLGIDYVLPHGYSVGGDRHEWWPRASQSEDQAAYAEDVDRAAESVMPTLRKLQAIGRPLLLAGHSQGGQLAATLAMRAVAPAVVASAWVPEPLRTSSPSPIVFVHGTDDPFAPYERTLDMVVDMHADDIKQVRIVPVVDVGHTFNGPLLETWKSELVEAIDEARSVRTR